METTREELERAFAHYRQVRERAIATGDWRPWAALFTEDARYVEHAYGEFRGRQAIEEWIVGVRGCRYSLQRAARSGTVIWSDNGGWFSDSSTRPAAVIRSVL